MSSGLSSKRFSFSAWPNPRISTVEAGVYAIWKDKELICCGMSGRGIDSKGKAAPERIINDCEALRLRLKAGIKHEYDALRWGESHRCAAIAAAAIRSRRNKAK
jgi:hypothetical protein